MDKLLLLSMIILLVIFFTGFFMILRKIRIINDKISEVYKKMNNLKEISEFFPDFIQKGEILTKNISDELNLKKNILNNLIVEAEKVSEKLDHLERKLKNNEINKETLDNVLILINQGFTPEEISQRLNIPLGEIELIVKLKKYLNSPIKEKL